MEEKIEKTPQEPIRTKGAIGYEIIEYPDGSWQIEYDESSIENDLAALTISEHLCTVITNGLMIAKKQATNTKEERHIQNILTKGRAARFGLKMLIDYMQPLYREFKKKQEEKSQNEEN